MANQAQCPNCGGYKTNQDILQIDPKTGKQPTSGCSFIITATVTLFVAGIILSMIAGEEFVNRAIVIAFPLFIGYALWHGISTGQARKRAYLLYKYQCILCGYKWEWQQGQPLPKVKVQPDLIAKGEKQLAEKQQHDMEALHHLTHQNKK